MTKICVKYRKKINENKCLSNNSKNPFGHPKLEYSCIIKIITCLINLWIITESKVHEKSSIYSLAINPPGTILACGSTEKAVGVYSVGVMDTRGPQDIMRLKGHTDNVRALVLNRDGTQVFLTDILCHHPKNIHKICMARKFHSLPDLKSQFFIWRV